MYVRAPHMPKCSSVSRSSVPTGFMGMAGNKGGVGISFRFYESELCFVNCHFASGDGQTQKRNDDYQTIEARMTFTDGQTSSLKDYIWYTPSAASNALSNGQTSSTPTRWFDECFFLSIFVANVFFSGGKSTIMTLFSGLAI